MKSYPKVLQGKFNGLEDSILWLNTLLECGVDWGKVPNHEIVILRERLLTMSEAIGDIYDRINKYHKD